MTLSLLSLTFYAWFQPKGSGSRLLAALLIAGILSFAPLAIQVGHAQESGTTVHTVSPGESLSSIARKYNVTVSILISHNSIRNANVIRPGQKILIPSVVQPLPTQIPTPRPTEHRLSAAIQSARVEATNMSSISTSQAEKLVVPPTPTRVYTARTGAEGYTTSGEPVYVVRRGDILAGIAARYNTTAPAIVRRNNLLSYDVVVSQRLIIPLYVGIPIAIPNAAPASLSAGRPTAIPAEIEIQPTSTPEPVHHSDTFLLPIVDVTPTTGVLNQ